MNQSEAITAFIEAHKPESIDLDYFDVKDHLDIEGGWEDRGMRYVEISQHETKSGHDQLIEWYEDAWEITWYTLPADERKTRDQQMPKTLSDPDFDCTLRFAFEMLKDPYVYDLNVTEWRDGELFEVVDLDNYAAD